VRFSDKDSDVIAAADKIAIEDTCDQARMTLKQSRIGLQIPAGHQSVRVHDQQRVWAPWVGKLDDLAGFMTGGAVVRNQMAQVVSSDDSGGNVSYAAITNGLLSSIDLGHRESRTARRA
jgi:hypothetical protein